MDGVPGKDADSRPETGFDDSINLLIADVEACLPAAGDDREAQLQREVFRERCNQALALAKRLGRAAEQERMLLDGDAYRARHALMLSRDFFWRRARR
ncbi:MAG TPA: hypothetical protein ENK16_02620 [Chromatiales bacterium]|nr:hypothetical protein [Chromatiales bacterium]